MKKLIKTWSFWVVVISTITYSVVLMSKLEYESMLLLTFAAYWACYSLFLEIKNSSLTCDNLKLACQLFLTTEVLKKYKKENERKTK